MAPKVTIQSTFGSKRSRKLTFSISPTSVASMLATSLVGERAAADPLEHAAGLRRAAVLDQPARTLGHEEHQDEEQQRRHGRHAEHPPPAVQHVVGVQAAAHHFQRELVAGVDRRLSPAAC